MTRPKSGLSSIRNILRRESKTNIADRIGLSSAHPAESSQGSQPKTKDDGKTVKISAVLSLPSQKSTLVRPIVPQHRETFFERFFNLPGELQIAVLLYVDVDTLFALRVACRAFYNVIQSHQSPIVRNILRQRDKTAAATILYPSPSPSTPATWSCLLQLTHRGSVVHKLAQKIVEFIMVKIYICHLLMYISHFLGSYRAALIQSRNELPDGVLPNHQRIQKLIIERYGLQHIYLAHAMFNLLAMVVYRKLRPPSYAGNLERKLRGWSKQPATTEDVVKLLVVGGLDEVNRIMDYKTYAERRDALDIFLMSISKVEDHKIDKKQPSLRWLRRMSTPSEVKDARVSTNAGELPSTIDGYRALYGLQRQTIPVRLARVAKPVADTYRVSEISTNLPDLVHLLLKPAERILLDQGFIEDAGDLPTFRDFIERAMQGEAAGLIFLDGWNNADDLDAVEVDEEQDGAEDEVEAASAGLILT